MRVKAYSYARFSDPRQARGSSEDRQLTAARDYAGQHGLELDESMVDRGVSAYTGANRKRGDLSRFLTMVEEGRVLRGSYLLVDSMDRLSRLPQAHAAHQLLSLALAGVRIVTLNDGAVFDEHVDLPMMINAVLKIQGAHEYSRELGRKVARGHSRSKARARDEGRVYSKTGPRWLRLKEDRSGWLPIPDRVALVQRIFEMHDQLGLGCTNIAVTLNREGVKDWGGSGWHDTTIRKMLRSPAVLGHYQPRFSDGTPDGDLALNYFGDAIVDYALWHRTQVSLDAGKCRRGRRLGIDEHRNLFAGRVFCLACGGVMNCARRSKDKVDVYQCYEMTRGRCENRTRYHAKRVESYAVRQIPFVDLSLARRAQNTESARALTVAAGECDQLAAKVAALLDQIEDGAAGPIRRRYEERVAQLAAKEAEIAQLQTAVGAHVSDEELASRREQIEDVSRRLRTAQGSELFELRARLGVALRCVERVDFQPGGNIEFSFYGGRVRIWSVDLGNPPPPAPYEAPGERPATA